MDVLDLVAAVIIDGAFGKIVDSLTQDIVMPSPARFLATSIFALLPAAESLGNAFDVARSKKSRDSVFLMKLHHNPRH